MADTTRNAFEPRDASVATPPSDRPSARVASRALEDAKEMGSELLTAMRDSATNLLDEQRRQAADEIVSIGDALRQSGDALEHKAGLGVGRYADEAARAIDDFAGRVRSSSWSEIAADVEDFARRWPIAFLAAAIAVGFVGGRLLLSAPPKPREPDLPRALPGTAVAVETGVRTEISDPYSAAREQG